MKMIKRTTDICEINEKHRLRCLRRRLAALGLALSLLLSVMLVMTFDVSAYDEEYGDDEAGMSVEIVLTTVIVGVVGGIVACVCVAVKYKTKVKSPIYPLDKYATLELTDSRDVFVTQYVTRVRINNSSDKK